jgi:4-hydroxybenzoate polyprenyltransferase
MLAIKRILSPMENNSIGLHAGVLTFVAIIFLRNLLELFLESNHDITISLRAATVLADHVHVFMSWAYIYLASVLILASVGGCKWLSASRVSLFGFTLIWIPPIVDGILGTSGAIVYQHNFDTFFSSFYGLFLPWVEVTYVTLGVRIEVALVLFVSYVYVAFCSSKNRPWLRAMLSVVCIYVAIFAMGYLPALITQLTGQSHMQLIEQSLLGVNATNAPVLWYFPILLPLTLIFLANAHPRIWRIITSCVRIERLLIYVFFVLAGFHHATKSALISGDWLNWYDIMFVVVLMSCVILAFIAMTVLNDITDRKIDALTNSSRPLIQDPSLISEYKFVALTMSLLSIGISFSFPISQTMLLIGMLSLACIYSLPPLRLRRFLFIAPLNLCVILVTCYLFGTALIWNNSTWQHLDIPFLLSFVVLFFFACQFKDIKDLEGDKLHGVCTLTTLFGARAAYRFLGFSLLISFSVMLWIGSIPLSITSLVVASLFLSVWLFSKKSEKLIQCLSLCLGLILFI